MKKVIIHLIIILLSLVAGIFLGYRFEFGQKNTVNVANEYDKGWEECRARYKELANTQSYEAEVEIRFLTGKIVKTDLNTINIDIIKFDYNADPNLDTRIIKIDDNTSINKVVKKDNEEYMEELGIYNKNFDNGQEQPPSEFKEIGINSTELKIGQNVQVWVEQDVRNIKEFTASKILIEFKS